MHLRLTNGQPETYTIGQLRRDNPHVSFPKTVSDEVLANYGVFPYTRQEQPTYDRRTQKLVEGGFSEVDDQWVKTWTVADKSPEEIQKYDLLMSAVVKEEAQRRILEVLPEWRQRNLTARAAELAAKGQSNWTPEEQAEWDAGQILWDKIKVIRAASDALESMDPIPSDYKDNSYWE